MARADDDPQALERASGDAPSGAHLKLEPTIGRLASERRRSIDTVAPGLNGTRVPSKT